MKKILISKNILQALLNKGLTREQMSEKLNVSMQQVLDREMRRNGLRYLKNSFFYKGDRNPAKRKCVRDKISKSVAVLWQKGYYKNRVNGMIGRTGFLHHNYKGKKYDFRKYLSDYHSISVCYECGRINRKIDIHHIDGNHENWLVTNLIPLCVPCHQKRHILSMKLPTVSLAVQGHFDAAHHLINYDGKCAKNHGHRFTYEVIVSGTVKDNGFLIDFGLLKKFLKDKIDLLLDHSEINDVVPFNPTAENLVIWLFELLQKKAQIKGIKQISLWETPECRAIITDKNMLDFYFKNRRV